MTEVGTAVFPNQHEFIFKFGVCLLGIGALAIGTLLIIKVENGVSEMEDKEKGGIFGVVVKGKRGTMINVHGSGPDGGVYVEGEDHRMHGVTGTVTGNKNDRDREQDNDV